MNRYQLYEQSLKNETPVSIEENNSTTESTDLPDYIDTINHKQDDHIDNLFENHLYVWSLLLYTK